MVVEAVGRREEDERPTRTRYLVMVLLSVSVTINSLSIAASGYHGAGDARGPWLDIAQVG